MRTLGIYTSLQLFQQFTTVGVLLRRKILFGQNLLLGSKFKSCWRRGWRCGDIKTRRAFIFVHQKSSSSGNCQTIKAGIKGSNSSLMGFQTRQIRTGKLQHKRWDEKCKGCFCFSWLLCPNDGLNLYSTPIVWMYEADFASSSYSVPSSAKFSWMSAGFCCLLFSSQQSGHL